MTEPFRIETHCPHCGRRNDQHAGLNGKPPADGDVAICWGCRKVGIFAVGPYGTGVRQATDQEAAEVMADPRVRAALGAMAESYDPDTATALWRGTGPPT